MEFLQQILNKIVIKLSNKQGVRVNSITYNDKGRFLIFHLDNNGLESHKSVLRAIYNALMSNEEFKKFGSKKVIIVAGIIEGQEFSYHHNVLISNTTTFQQYYNLVKDYIISHYDDTYGIDVIPQFKVRVWNMDELSNKNIKITKSAISSKSNKGFQTKVSMGPINQTRLYSSYIKPIKPHNIDPTISSFATMDIETIDFKGTQIPIAISLAYYDSNKVKTKLFLIKPSLFKSNHEKAIDLLWKEYFDFISENSYLFNNIFVHNLGSFDGLFLYKALSNYSNKPEMVSTIIDDSNKFIQISLNLSLKNKKLSNINWKDSYRLFSVSLNDLCSVFKVDGKTSKYDPRFNNLDLFDNPELLKEFKAYSLQDALALYQALEKAQEIYLRDFSVDIVKSLSSSSLSLKIFRTLFLKTDIPILKGTEDSFIRKGYFGGATDYYKAYAENLQYDDVNSLYPYAMLKPMPHKLIKFHKTMNNINLNDFFGFCLAEVETPKNILKPLLPYKHKGKTIFPTGTWIGVYFSEELKAVLSHGYKINLIKGYEFSKIDLFTYYVNHFFNIKKNSVGAERWIAKMHLNQLYGIFGRRKDLLQTMNISNEILPQLITTKLVKNIIEINKDISAILVHSNTNPNIVKDLNSFFKTNISNSYSEVNSNVGIAAAVTAYGRIHMIPYRLHPGTVYTDTDSIFTTIPLPEEMFGSDLGLMKDELKGSFIKEGYFLGIKQYGYWYTDSNNNIIEQSVFAGVTRNSLSFNEIKSIFNGETIIKSTSNRFFRNFTNLSISIRPSKVSVKFQPFKILVNNNYIPLNIFNLNHKLDNRGLFFKLKNKLRKFIKHYIT